MTSDSPNPYRLPTNVVPVNYQLVLTPDIEAATFTGVTVIELDVLNETSSFSFNAVELSIDSIEVSGGAHTQSASWEFVEEYERADVTLTRALPVGPATITVSYRGVLNDKLVGFYKSTYTDGDGNLQSIATTQFEATDARRAFPCWDEPTFKATFDVSLRVPTQLAAFSNSPIASETDHGDGTRTVTFSRTMKMSSYLVAFVVGPFEATEPASILGTPIRVVCPNGKIHLTSFALEAAQFALDFFSRYFDIPYPGDKLDMVAVPDFAFGAMENLGCIVYRETALLVDPATASLAERERVADVVAHEIAHMWFGDLVTMQWWEGIWLNEAFATFMETLCVEHFRPQWKKWLSFGTQRDMALEIDGLHSTRPIEYEVVSPADMRGMFDLLTYEKGGSVLRMLEQYLGPETFRDGIRLYLRRHAYANTVTIDLWNALEEISGEPVREMMDTWILQGGHPLVTYANGQISQQAFSYGPLREGVSAIGTTWMTPLMTRSVNGGPVRRQLLSSNSVELVADGPMVVNAGGWGVYRTRYGSNELAALAGSLDGLDELERAVLFADTWAALFSNQILWADFIALAKGLGDVDEPATWSLIHAVFDFASRAANEDQRNRLAVTVGDVFSPQLARLGWDPASTDSELAAQVRAITISTLGTYGHDANVVAEAQRRFDTGTLEGDTANAILRVTANANRPGDYEEFLKRFENALDPQEEQRYQRALAHFPDPDIALDAARRCLEEFRTQDGPMTLGLLTRNRVSGPAVWRFITERWDEAMERFPVNGRDRMCVGIPTFIADRAFADSVASFCDTHPIAGEQRTIAQHIERMRIGLDFADAIRPQL